MRTPVQKGNRGQKASTLSVPAPIGGWNAKDAVAAMDAKDAFKLINWFPRTGDVMLRLGSNEHCTGLDDPGSPAEAAQVATLMTYRPTSGTQEMFGAAGEFIYETTAQGDVGAPVVSGLNSPRWQYTNFTTVGGNFLIAVNGADDMELYNGTIWNDINAISTPAITGVATSSLVNVNVHKHRVWYVQQASLSAWYSATGTFAGALTEFPLGAVFSKGGVLVAMGTWTFDGGAGMDDAAVFITDQGEVAIYQGNDPSNINDWQLVGTYSIGAPIGYRCMCKLGGDLLIITDDGVASCGREFSGSANPVKMTDKIQGAMAQAATLYKQNTGWEMIYFSKGGMLLLNVPVGLGVQEQYVMNTVTGAWCKFQGWNANCFTIFNDNLYFGEDGRVMQAWTGKADDDALITYELMPAYQYMRNRTSLKHWKMLRINTARDANPDEFLLGFDTEFADVQPTSSASFPTATGSLWDEAEWDVDVWSGGFTTTSPWQTITGVGYCGTPHIVIRSKSATVFINSFDYVFTYGGII